MQRIELPALRPLEALTLALRRLYEQYGYAHILHDAPHGLLRPGLYGGLAAQNLLHADGAERISRDDHGLQTSDKRCVSAVSSVSWKR